MADRPQTSLQRLSPLKRQVRLPQMINLADLHILRLAQRNFNSGPILQFYNAEQRPFPAACLDSTNKQTLF